MLYLSLISGLTVILAGIGLRHKGVLGVIFIGQAGYWLISYVMRPGILLLFQPAPRFGDSVADPRIASGGYETFMPQILSSIAIGIGCYVFFACIIVWALGRKKAAPTLLGFSGVSAQTASLYTFLVSYSVGWLFRVASLTTPSNSLIDTVSGLAIVGAAGIIVFLPSRPGGRTVVLFAAFIGELGWSVLSASKTPIIAAALCLAMRWSISGWGRKRVSSAVFVMICGIFAFPALQRIKTSDETQHVLQAADVSYPTYIQPLMSVVRRFDLFSAVTDATLLESSRWMSTTEFLFRIMDSFIPQALLAHEKIGVGTLWSTQVRSYSLGTANENVSLAEGFVAEGYALGGYAGVVFGALFILMLAVFVAWLVSHKQVFLSSLGLLLVSFPVLFERGILGSVETIGKSLQIAFLVWLLSLVVQLLEKSFAAPTALHLRDSTERQELFRGEIASATAKQRVELVVGPVGDDAEHNHVRDRFKGRPGKE